MRQAEQVRVIGSVVVHAIVLALLLRIHARRDPPKPPATITIEVVDRPVVVPAASPGSSKASHGGGGHPNPTPTRRARSHVQASKQSESPWTEVVESSEAGTGTGEGTGAGGGFGGGIGLGVGGVEGLGSIPAPPAPPPPPPPSRARPAKLRHPARQRPVEEDRLYVALITVDEDGDVIGAHMLAGAPGARGELASSVIWQFHYEPALDAAGHPIQSTFEQEFQIW